jgi:hypothetical protein
MVTNIGVLGIIFILSFIGNICGYTPGYENYKYLFLWDIMLPVRNPT